ncbi:MAG: hypothetical protein JWN70_1029 [Planctomycetaceae bacterium]|nr:hypothetical protein [Planctomycetaceae bacterium]
MEPDLADFVQYETIEESPSKLENDSAVDLAQVPHRAHRIQETAIATLCALLGLGAGYAAIGIFWQNKPGELALGIGAAIMSLFWFRCVYGQFHPQFTVIPASRRFNAFLCGLMCYGCILAVTVEHTAERLVPFLIELGFAIVFAVACLLLLLPSDE